MFNKTTTKMPRIVRNSSNTQELTVALYFKWTSGETIFTLTALPRQNEPCETIQLYQWNDKFHVDFEIRRSGSEVVIIILLILKVLKIIISCYFVIDIMILIACQKISREFFYLYQSPKT